MSMPPRPAGAMGPQRAGGICMVILAGKKNLPIINSGKVNLTIYSKERSMEAPDMDKKEKKNGRKPLVFAEKFLFFMLAGGFWAMGIFAITTQYWFTQTARYGSVKTHLYVGNEAVFHGLGLICIGCVFLSMLQKTASKAAWVASLSLIGAVGFMLAPAFIK
jgi:hypothetical protein